MRRRLLPVLALLLTLFPALSYAQTTNSRTQSGTGTAITATGSSLNTNITNASLAVTGTFFQGTQPVSGTVAVSNSFLLDATFTGRFAAAFASADNIAAQTTTAVHGLLMGWDGAGGNWDRLQVDTSGFLKVTLAANSFGTLTVSGTVTANQGGAPWSENITQFGGVALSTGTGASGTGIPRVTVSNDSNILATQSGTWNIGTLTTITTNTPSGSVAHDGVGTSVNPLLTGCYASAAAPTDVSNDGDATREWCLRNGARSVNLSTAGTLYDARQIRALASGTDTVTITDGAGALNVIVDSGSVTATNAFLLDATYTGRMPAGASPADAESNTNTALSRIGSYLFGYNGTTWDRLQVDASKFLKVNVQACTGCGLSVTDAAAFTSGASAFTPSGGEYNLSATALTSGQQGTQALTAYRSAYSTLYGSNALELATQTNPLNVQLSGVTGFFGGSTLQDSSQTQIATLDPFGRLQSVSTISDGSGRYAAMRGAEGAQIQDAGIVTSPSIAPALQCPYVQAFSQTASATIVTNPGGKALHICWFNVVSSTAQSFSLVEGTGTVCATGIKALDGSTGGSMAFAQNGGLHAISDRITLPMQVLGDNLCVIQSSTGNMSGTIVYGIY